MLNAKNIQKQWRRWSENQRRLVRLWIRARCRERAAAPSAIWALEAPTAVAAAVAVVATADDLRRAESES